MRAREKIRFLKSKGLKHGDIVDFRVENQISGIWMAPTEGKLILEGPAAPYLDVEDFDVYKRGFKIVTINNGYDAYINTIEKKVERHWSLDWNNRVL